MTSRQQGHYSNLCDRKPNELIISVTTLHDGSIRGKRGEKVLNFDGDKILNGSRNLNTGGTPVGGRLRISHETMVPTREWSLNLSKRLGRVESGFPNRFENNIGIASSWSR